MFIWIALGIILALFILFVWWLLSGDRSTGRWDPSMEELMVEDDDKH